MLSPDLISVPDTAHAPPLKHRSKRDEAAVLFKDTVMHQMSSHFNLIRKCVLVLFCFSLHTRLEPISICRRLWHCETRHSNRMRSLQVIHASPPSLPPLSSPDASNLSNLHRSLLLRPAPPLPPAVPQLSPRLSACVSHSWPTCCLA